MTEAPKVSWWSKVTRRKYKYPRRDLTLHFYGTDYWWFGRAYIHDGVPYKRQYGGPNKEHYKGLIQGFGPFAMQVTWPTGVPNAG